MTKIELMDTIKNYLLQSGITMSVDEGNITIDELLNMVNLIGLELTIINPEMVTIVSKQQLCRLYTKVNELK